MSAESKILAAKVTIGMEHAFWGSLMGHLTFKSDLTCPTAWTDGRTLGYNPVFIDSLSHDGVVAVIAHELDHCAKGHMYRREGRDPKTWNIACDKANNGDLRKEFKLPDGVVYPEGDEEGKSAEWIFARLKDNQTPPPQPEPEPEDEPEDKPGDPGTESGDASEDEDGEPGNEPGDGEGDEPGEGDGEGDTEGDGDASGDSTEDGEGDGQGNPTPGDGDPLGEVRDAPTQPDGDGNEPISEDEWKQLTAEALQASKLMGHSLGEGMERGIRDALKPRIDIRSLLLRFFQDRTNGDYTWTRPSTRYLPMGIYLPKLESTAMGEVAIMVDTSGSVDVYSLAYARSIVESVIEETSPAAVTVYYADDDVKRIDRFERGDALQWQPKGNGGTDFRPALAAIEDEGQAVCMLCITDLYGTFPDVPPSIPVLWLSTTEGLNAPFGETIYVDR